MTGPVCLICGEKATPYHEARLSPYGAACRRLTKAEVAKRQQTQPQVTP